MPAIDFGPNRIEHGHDGEVVEGFVVPRFGRACVCCNADAGERVVHYPVSLDGGGTALVEMPVCWGCREHAVQWSSRPVVAAIALIAVLAIVGTGLYYAFRAVELVRGLELITLGGCALVVVGVALLVRNAIVAHRERNQPGHHPGLTFTVESGSARLTTRNDRLADELLALNTGARRTSDPVARRRGLLPEARVIKGAVPIDPDDHASEIAQRVVSGKPADLAFVRSALAAGTVQHLLVESLLAQTERLLGRRDLIARYQALRGERQASA